ncbi:MAG: hypothetical protein IPJ69_02060 [Deltaproteobacteria bacterium]|nr:MAG: hypothetical protein IPJ69_02060 [Deltaproteobacteria bacterium]
MARGGLREGAGRKKGMGNILTQELREKIRAEEIIDFLQDVVRGNVSGASIGERTTAAVALLKKVLPDINKAEVDVLPKDAIQIYLPEVRVD